VWDRSFDTGSTGKDLCCHDKIVTRCFHEGLRAKLGLQHVVFEGDNKVVMGAVSSSEKDFSSHGNLIEEIKVCKSFFHDCQFLCTPRACNVPVMYRLFTE
jgi:hypothetical protein